MDSTEQPLVLFDGECAFCNRSLDLVLKHERVRSLRFAASQSEFGRRKLAEHGILGAPGSIVLIENRQMFTRSTATLRLTKYLRAPWRWLGVLSIIPAPIRDWVYSVFAANRYRISQHLPACPVRSPEVQSRFFT